MLWHTSRALVAEIGRGGSSILPHKRVPVGSALAVACAHRVRGEASILLGAMAQEHERAAGAWQAEWAAVPDLFRYADGAVDRVRRALETLEVDPERMRRNLAATDGLIMAEALATALAERVGRPEAQRIVRAVCERARQNGADLGAAALADGRVGSVLAPEAIARALDPGSYLGATEAFIDRALAAYRAARQPVTG